MDKLSILYNKLRLARSKDENERHEAGIAAVTNLLNTVDLMSRQSTAISLFPPDKIANRGKKWFSPADLINAKFVEST